VNVNHIFMIYLPLLCYN